jgi:two-component system NtrC family sensor kinase
MPPTESLKLSDASLQADFQLILNAIVEGVCGLDGAGKATFCNEALLKMTGYHADELVGKSVHQLLHPSRPDGTKYPSEECVFSKAFEGGQPVHIVGEFLWRKDGTSFPADYWARPLQTTSSPTVAVVTVQDITESLRAQDVRVQNEEKFRRILAKIPDVAWTSDRNGRTVYISPKVEAIFGYTKQEVCSSGACMWMGRIHPEDFGRVDRAYRALFEKGKPFDEEYRIRRKDEVWIWVHDRATGTREERGVLYADGLLTDITERKRVEAELRSQTALLEAQTNSTIDGMLVVDSRGQRLIQNQRLGELFEIPSHLMEDKSDRNMLKYVVTKIKDPDSFLKRVNYLYRHPDETSRDEIELKNGTILDRYTSPVVDKNGISYGRIWTFRDITDRKRNDDVLQQLSIAVEQSPISVVITDAQGNITYVNRKFTECTGYTREEVLGKNPRVLRSGLASTEFYQNLWSTILQGKEWSGDFCNRKKNGDIYWEAAMITPITNPKGAITHFLAIKEDITERRRAEREVRLTKASVETASDSVFWIDPQAQVVYANQAACRTLGYTREELLSLSIPDIAPAIPQATWSELWNEIKWRGSMTLETQHKTKAGRVFPVEITANYLEFDGQEYSFAFVRDITERRELESQLRHAQKLEGVGQLAAGIAHEINTPTQFVTDNLTFLRDSWKTTRELLEEYRAAIRNTGAMLPPDVAACLAAAEKNCDFGFIETEVPLAIDQGLEGARRVAKIVRAMKEFSHPDSAEKTAANLNQAIESTITVARNEWKYVAEIATEFDENLPAVVCYPGDINQVVLNLIVNAAHAIKGTVKDGEKGKITIRTRTHGEFAEISVSDTGTGIPEAIRTRVFDPFFTTKEVGKGTGQGLALAHTVVVKKHHGRIWFETQMGRGTTFFVELPINQSSPSGVIHEQAADFRR